MDLLHNLFVVATTPHLLFMLILNAVVGSAAFVAAVKKSNDGTVISSIVRYGYAFVAVNFIARCFVILFNPADPIQGLIVLAIAGAAVLMLAVGAVLNVCTDHVETKISNKFGSKQ